MPFPTYDPSAIRYEITIDIAQFNDLNSEFIRSLNQYAEREKAFPGINFSFPTIDLTPIQNQLKYNRERYRAIKYKEEYNNKFNSTNDNRNPFTGVKLDILFKENSFGKLVPTNPKVELLYNDNIGNNVFKLTLKTEDDKKETIDIIKLLRLPLNYPRHAPEDPILRARRLEAFSEQNWTPPDERDRNSNEDLTPYNVGGLVGVTEQDATLLLKVINNTFAHFGEYYKYFAEDNNLKDFFGIDPTNKTKLSVKIENLSPLLKDIDLLEKLGILSNQKANDFRDLLYGYVAAVVSTKTSRVSYARHHEEVNEKRNDHGVASHSGGGVMQPKFRGDNWNIDNPESIVGAKVIISLKTDEDNELCSDSLNREFSLEELTAHELLGHAAGYLFQVPNYDGNEALKYTDIIRRLEGVEERDIDKYPHPDNSHWRSSAAEVAENRAKDSLKELQDNGASETEINAAQQRLKEATELRRTIQTAVQRNETRSEKRAITDRPYIGNDDDNWRKVLEEAKITQGIIDDTYFSKKGGNTEIDLTDPTKFSPYGLEFNKNYLKLSEANAAAEQEHDKKRGKKNKIDWSSIVDPNSFSWPEYEEGYSPIINYDDIFGTEDNEPEDIGSIESQGSSSPIFPAISSVLNNNTTAYTGTNEKYIINMDDLILIIEDGDDIVNARKEYAAGLILKMLSGADNATNLHDYIL